MSPDAGPLRGKRVLVVEDELLVSWMVQDLLSDLGCVILGPAATVAQALEAVATAPIDLAVLDLNLDGEMSYPVADALAAAGVPFAFATGYHRDRLLEAYRRFPILQKPLLRSDLRETLEALLRPQPPAAQAPAANRSPGAAPGA
jgi:CheY-like chemotaxis protein